MPARRASPEIVGTVCAGLGEGTRFTTLGWAAAAFAALLGGAPHPGTFNLRMHGAAWAALRRRLHAAAGLPLQPPPDSGCCAAKCFRVRVGDRVDGLLVLPEVAAYPDDKLEIVAACGLREALGAADGARVALAVGL